MSSDASVSTPESPRSARLVDLGCVHLCNGLVPERDGGMVPSILGLTGALVRRGERVTIVTPTPSDRAGLSLPPGVNLGEPGEPSVPDAVRRAEVVHMHGLWQGHVRRGAAAARMARVPYLIAAHGMADPWALRQKALKKRIYRALVEGRNLRHASCLHALARREVGFLRTLAPRVPICLVPNGVDLSPYDGLPPRETLHSQHPELAGRFVLLFFGRLHHKKGLDLLAQAFARVAPEWPELHLLLAGRDDGAWTPFEAGMRERGLLNRVTHVGHVAQERARAVWAACDAFILPSYSEGFSMAILEAMACRRPAIITTACYFPEASAAGAAFEVEADAVAICEALRDLRACGPADREAMGRRGRCLVEARYTWPYQAQCMQSVYDWLRGGGPAPDCLAD